MLLTKLQIINGFLNLFIVLLGIGLTFLAIKLTKIKDKQSRLIFILYMICWIPTLMCREYTGLMHEHLHRDLQMSLVFIPLVVYGAIGLFYRPMVDFFSIKMKSRRNVIIMSLALQLASFIPFLIIQNFATNIIQSIGCGIGASCIGLFNLMFDEQQSKQTVFSTVSILAIPPILAQFFAGAIESFTAGFVPTIYTHQDYVDTMWTLWLIGAILIVACFVIAGFIKPRPHLLYQKEKTKTVIKSKNSKFAFAFLCVAALLVMYIKWSVAGPTVSIQVSYIAAHYGTDTKYYEGYFGLIHTLGTLIGTIITGYLLKKHNDDKTRLWIVLASCLVGIIHLILNGFFTTVGAFVGTLAINGLSYGLIYPVLVGIAVSKIFVKSKYYTPMGTLNLFFAAGNTFGTFMTAFYKAPVFEQIQGFSTYSFDDFILVNWHIMLICITFEVLIAITYVVSRAIYVKHPDQKVKFKKLAKLTSDTEM